MAAAKTSASRSSALERAGSAQIVLSIGVDALAQSKLAACAGPHSSSDVVKRASLRMAAKYMLWVPTKARKPMAPVTKSPRKLGSSALSVFPIGLGCMSLSGAYGKTDDAQGIRVIHHAIDHGVTFLDSSDMYGWGHNETLLGKALAGGRRAKVVLGTQFGQTQTPGGAHGGKRRPDYAQ